jgi:integrase
MSVSTTAILRGILSDDMPRKYQNPKLQIRRDVERPFYFIRYSARGRRPTQFLGFVGEVPVKEAQKKRAAFLEVLNAGRLLIQADLKFSQVCDRFLAVRVPQLGICAQKRYALQIKNHILPEFGRLKLCEIDGSMVERWLNDKKEAGLGWWTRIDLKGVLSAIFTAAKSWKLWEGDNPTEGVLIGRKKYVREKRLLTVEEMRLLLAALPERPKFIVLIIFGLGLRISEVLGLRWSDVNFAEKIITIQRRWHRGNLADETKSEASAAVLRLGSSMLQEFRTRRNRDHCQAGFIFQCDNSFPPDDRDLLREEFRPVVKRLGLYYKGFGWHAFRRANITYRQQIGGATPLEAQRAARHASLDMTYLYTLSDHERETAQQQAMFDKLMETPEGKPQ